MPSEDTQKTQAQLDQWRTKLDVLKVKGHLFKMESKEKQDEALAAIESAYGKAKAKFEEMSAATGEEAGKIGSGFSAAWGAFKDAYAGATKDEAE